MVDLLSVLAGRHEGADWASTHLGTDFRELLAVVELPFVVFNDHLFSDPSVHD